jgi:hypothetical protein
MAQAHARSPEVKPAIDEMGGMKYGCARVPTDGQNPAMQLRRPSLGYAQKPAHPAF